MPCEVELTDKFIKNKDLKIKHFNDYFHPCEDLEQYIEYLIYAACFRDYSFNNNCEPLAGFGSVWIRGNTMARLYKPTKGGWEKAINGKLPECGIILKMNPHKEKFFVATNEDVDEKYSSGVPLDEFV